MEKIRNNILEKVKFFSLYLGQEVIELENEFQKTEVTLSSLNLIKTHKFEKNAYLCLRSLHNITDEEVKIAFNNMMDFIGDVDVLESSWDTEKKLSGFRSRIIDEDFTFLPVTDYLRSRRFALPWMNLDIEDLIEYGWIKLEKKL